jgi:hypothetical protein
MFLLLDSLALIRDDALFALPLVFNSSFAQLEQDVKKNKIEMMRKFLIIILKI